MLKKNKTAYIHMYIDVEDELEILRTEVAIHIAKRMCVDKKLKIMHQIFEEKQYRLEYIVELQKKLNISQKDAKELCEKVRNLIE